MLSLNKRCQECLLTPNDLIDYLSNGKVNPRSLTWKSISSDFSYCEVCKRYTNEHKLTRKKRSHNPKFFFIFLGILLRKRELLPLLPTLHAFVVNNPPRKVLMTILPKGDFKMRALHKCSNPECRRCKKK